MSGADSVAGRERVRLFCALTLPDEALDALVHWQRNALRCDARASGRDQLHVTLAFLGHRPADEVEAVAGALREAVAARGDPLVLTPLRYRETRSVGMLVLEDEGGKAAALAAELHDRLEALGVYRQEARPWLSLDLALGIGGLPRGRIVEIFGPEASGKTTLVYHVLAEAQRRGGICAFIDAEHSMDPIYARRIGVNIDELLVSQPDTGEQALEIAELLIRSGALDVVAVDSVAALVPKAEIEGEMGDSHVGL